MIDERVRAAFYESYQNELEALKMQYPPEHKFSRSFERKMNALLSGRTDGIKLGRKLKLILIAAVLMLFILGFSIGYIISDGFRVTDYGDYSLIFALDYANAPRHIETIYGVSADMSEYSVEILFEPEFYRSENYVNGEKYLMFSQYVKENCGYYFKTAKNQACKFLHLKRR